LKRTLEILNKPEQVANILTSLRKDNHIAKTFEGTAKNGYLKGFYTNLALINGVVIGYVKIRGQYNRDKGDLKLEIVPSNLYWIVLTFAILVIGFLTCKGLTENKIFFIGSFLFLIMALGWTLAFVLEGKSFMRHINRIINLTNE
jgi:uncharacterized membrane protein